MTPRLGFEPRYLTELVFETSAIPDYAISAFLPFFLCEPGNPKEPVFETGAVPDCATTAEVHKNYTIEEMCSDLLILMMESTKLSIFVS
jgi:hypothetical protein